MATMVPFTNNYSDRSTREGYQFEFFCQRCGNGYTSPFQHSVTGFGGRLLQMGGDLLGGEVGNQASRLGWDAQWLKSSSRGSTRDKALGKAVEQMQPHFTQCHRCGQIKPKMAHPPFSSAQGKLIQEKICPDCWREWIGMGTKVINELRLPLSDPQAQKVFDQHMMEFLNLA